MNQYTFNLETDYLQHDKFGAHYSKNWDKKKQDEYNEWYYKTHKDKWKGINREKLTTARRNKNDIPKAQADIEKNEWLAKSDEHNADAYEYAKGNKLERQYGYENFAKPNGETFSQHTKNMRELAKMHRFFADMNKGWLENIKDPNAAGYTASGNHNIADSVSEIRKDRSKGINMVKFDAYRAKKRVSSALNKLKNIKL